MLITTGLCKILDRVRCFSDPHAHPKRYKVHHKHVAIFIGIDLSTMIVIFIYSKQLLLHRWLGSVPMKESRSINMLRCQHLLDCQPSRHFLPACYLESKTSRDRGHSSLGILHLLRLLYQAMHLQVERKSCSGNSQSRNGVAS